MLCPNSLVFIVVPVYIQYRRTFSFSVEGVYGGNRPQELCAEWTPYPVPFCFSLVTFGHAFQKNCFAVLYALKRSIATAAKRRCCLSCFIMGSTATPACTPIVVWKSPIILALSVGVSIPLDCK